MLLKDLAFGRFINNDVLFRLLRIERGKINYQVYELHHASRKSDRQLLIAPQAGRMAVQKREDSILCSVQPRWMTTRYYTSKPNRSGSSVHNNDDLDMDISHRHTGVRLHPDSISRTILPGNIVLRTTRTGTVLKRHTEWVHGYFWMIKDLKRSQDKPIVSNEILIPEDESIMFPPLTNVPSLTGDVVDLPEYFFRKNRSKDPLAHCTLVAICYREYGYQLLPTWLVPFKRTFEGNDRVEVFQLNINEGWFNRWFLRSLIQTLAKRNTPREDHPHTFLYFGGTALDMFRDSLFMHNLMTSYVFLLDGLGRVRFAGSGPATDEEVDLLIALAHELTPKPGTSRPPISRARPGTAVKKVVKPTRR